MLTGSGDNLTHKVGNFRWMICGLLFFATTVNYIDRQVISILAPDLQRIIGWSEIDYSNIVFAFQLAYAIMLFLAGGLIDRIGVRLGFTLAVVWWSFAAMGHALAGSALAFGIWRFLLAVGEAANFPASIKTVAEWFPKKERALATGVFNSGTNIGAILTPLAVAWIMRELGAWQWAFILTGLSGFVWVALWLRYYRSPEVHPRLSKAELAYIQSEPEPPMTKMPWLPLLKYRQTWAFTIGKFMTDPIWWFFLFWLPKFLNTTHGINTQQMAVPLAVVYTVASVGSVGGGWLPEMFLNWGWSINAARKGAMLCCALCVPFVIIASQTHSLWLAIALISLACACHQGWSANIFTLSSDMFPKKAVGSVVGIGGFGGAVGGLLIAKLAGYVLQYYGSYKPMFVLAGTVYLAALLIIHILAPRLKPAELD